MEKEYKSKLTFEQLCKCLAEMDKEETDYAKQVVFMRYNLGLSQEEIDKMNYSEYMSLVNANNFELIFSVPNEVNDYIDYEGKRYYFSIDPDQLTVQHFGDIQHIQSSTNLVDKMLTTACLLCSESKEEMYDYNTKVGRMDIIKNIPAEDMFMIHCFFLSSIINLQNVTRISMEILEIHHQLKTQ